MGKLFRCNFSNYVKTNVGVIVWKFCDTTPPSFQGYLQITLPRSRTTITPWIVLCPIKCQGTKLGRLFALRGNIKPSPIAHYGQTDLFQTGLFCPAVRDERGLWHRLIPWRRGSLRSSASAFCSLQRWTGSSPGPRCEMESRAKWHEQERPYPRQPSRLKATKRKKWIMLRPFYLNNQSNEENLDWIYSSICKLGHFIDANIFSTATKMVKLSKKIE